MHPVPAHFMLRAHLRSNVPALPRARAIGVAPEGRIMSQFSKMKHSRDQWKHKPRQRGPGERYQRRENARFRAERHQVTQTLKATQVHLREPEARLRGLPTRPKLDVDHLA